MSCSIADHGSSSQLFNGLFRDSLFIEKIELFFASRRELFISNAGKWDGLIVPIKRLRTIHYYLVEYIDKRLRKFTLK